MIYITGDCHGRFGKFSMKNFPEQKNMSKEDTVIICGDFGGIWDRENMISSEEKHWLKWLEDKNFTTVFVDGNHENFDRIARFEVIEWNGGKVHKIGESIFHLMRGEVYNIEGKTFFTFGGASSHDISDGIIEMDEQGKWRKTAKIWKKYGKSFRVKNLEWWEQELPSGEELEHAIETLKQYDYHVDYIITHCWPQHIVEKYIDRADAPDLLTKFFDEIAVKMEFKKWFFGHYHCDDVFEEKYRVLYKEIVRI